MSNLYYKEKLIKLHDTLFLSVEDVKSRFVKNEDLIETMIFASKNVEDLDLQARWGSFWMALNTQPPLLIHNEVVSSSFCQTVLKKRKKSLEKFLYFILEEYYNVM